MDIEVRVQESHLCTTKFALKGLTTRPLSWSLWKSISIKTSSYSSSLTPVFNPSSFMNVPTLSPLDGFPCWLYIFSLPTHTGLYQLLVAIPTHASACSSNWWHFQDHEAKLSIHGKLMYKHNGSTIHSSLLAVSEKDSRWKNMNI